MSKSRLSLVFFILLPFAAGGLYAGELGHEYSVLDSSGKLTFFAHTPRRIIPLLPSLAELVSEILPSDEFIVGVSAYTNFPPALKSKPQVGSYAKPSLEAIVALKPDLVLASRDGTPKDIVERLRKLSINVITVNTETVAGLRESYPVVGTAIGKKYEAERALAEFDSKLASIKKRAEKRRPLGVMLQVGEDPLVVAAGKTFLDEGLKIIGASNVYPEAEKTYPRVAVEDVLKRNPEVIVLVVMGDDLSQFKRAEKRWRSFPKLAATKKNQIILLRSDALVRPGPRFPEGLAELERVVFGNKAESK